MSRRIRCHVLSLDKLKPCVRYAVDERTRTANDRRCDAHKMTPEEEHRYTERLLKRIYNTVSYSERFLYDLTATHDVNRSSRDVIIGATAIIADRMDHIRRRLRGEPSKPMWVNATVDDTTDLDKEILDLLQKYEVPE